MNFFGGWPNFTNSAVFTAAEFFLGGFSAVAKNSADPDIRRRLGDLMLYVFQFKCKYTKAQYRNCYILRVLRKINPRVNLAQITGERNPS